MRPQVVVSMVFCGKEEKRGKKTYVMHIERRKNITMLTGERSIERIARRE